MSTEMSRLTPVLLLRPKTRNCVRARTSLITNFNGKAPDEVRLGQLRETPNGTVRRSNFLHFSHRNGARAELLAQVGGRGFIDDYLALCPRLCFHKPVLAAITVGHEWFVHRARRIEFEAFKAVQTLAELELSAILRSTRRESLGTCVTKAPSLHLRHVLHEPLVMCHYNPSLVKNYIGHGIGRNPPRHTRPPSGMPV